MSPKDAMPADENGHVIGLREHAAQTHWVFADRVIYPFWAGLPVPPELAEDGKMGEVLYQRQK